MREDLEKKASEHIRSTYDEHNYGDQHKVIIKLMCDFAEKHLQEYVEQLEKEANDPYSCFPQCDVDGCERVSCNGGGCWRDTGYWSVCSKHSQDHREGKPQPKMRPSSIERENSRDKDGYLTAKNK